MRITSLVLNVFGSMIRIVGFILLIIFFHSNPVVLGLSIAGLAALAFFIIPTFISLALRAKIPLWFIFDFLFVSVLGGIFYFTWIPVVYREPQKIIDESQYKYRVGDEVKITSNSPMYVSVKDETGTISSLEDNGKYYVKLEKISLTIKESDLVKI